MRKKEEPGVPWTCECCPTDPEYYVRYYLYHGSFEGGRKRFTKLACSEHLTKVIASAMRIQGYPGVVVEDIKGREKWKRDTFVEHYGMSPEAFKEQLQQPDATYTSYSEEATDKMLREFMEHFPSRGFNMKPSRLHRPGAIPNPCCEIKVSQFDTCVLPFDPNTSLLLHYWARCRNCYLEDTSIFDTPQRVENVTWSTETRTLTFELRDGIKYHFSADDIKEATFDGEFCHIVQGDDHIKIKFYPDGGDQVIIPAATELDK